jgi:hypothetical protein
MLLVMSNFLKQNFSSARVVFILLQTHWNWEIHGMLGTCRGLKQQSQQQKLGFHHQGIPNICKLANKQSRGFRPTKMLDFMKAGKMSNVEQPKSEIQATTSHAGYDSDTTGAPRVS